MFQTLHEFVSLNCGFCILQLRHTSLHYAATYGQTDIAYELITAGANVNAQTSVFTTTALLYTKNLANCQVLTPHAFYYVFTQDGETPLYLASKFGHPEIVKLLTDAGADTNIVANLINYTPLLMATARGHAAVIRNLLDAGASIHAVDWVRVLHNLLRQYFNIPLCLYPC
jgi:ankyrin repeat protein